MVIVKATKDSEKAGALPDPQLTADMNKFNDGLAKAGVLLAYEGLHPSSKGGENRTVTDGPFAETEELVAGFWLWQVKSLEEAIEWVKRCPNPHEGEADIEILQVFEPEDFAPAFSEEDVQQENNFRAQLADKVVEK
jgi:hypothetical protein